MPSVSESNVFRSPQRGLPAPSGPRSRGCNEQNNLNALNDHGRRGRGEGRGQGVEGAEGQRLADLGEGNEAWRENVRNEGNCTLAKRGISQEEKAVIISFSQWWF